MSKKIWIASLLLSGAVVVGPSLVKSQANKSASAATPPAAAPATADPSSPQTVASAAPTGGGLAALNTGDPATLELRANQTFTRGQYALALPMLQKVADNYKDNPDKLGPVEEKIRVCQKNIAKPPVVDPASAAQQPAAPVTAEQRKPHPAPQAGETVVLDIKELGNFEYDVEHGGNIPEDVKHLSGAKIRTHGFMIPLDQAENISEFALVPSLFACCFGQPPQVQHTIVVHCPKGKAVSYYPDEIVVEGALKVEEKKDDGYIVSIFEIDASSVRPAPK